MSKKKANQIRLIIVTDEHNLLKDRHQTIDEYKKLKNKCFSTLMQELS